MSSPSVPQPLVLIVDDAPANLQIVHSILEPHYKIRIANNGFRAIEIAHSAPPPDLILLDVMMPGIDGYEVCRRLKQDPATSQIPILFLTSKTDSADEELGFAVGAVDYIHKPFSSPVILARVATHLALRDSLRNALIERQRADHLLANILPESALLEIKETGRVSPCRYDGVAVLFCDLVGFTPFCERHSPEQVVTELSDLFVEFEAIARNHGLEKIKTIGDAFMATAGLLNNLSTPFESALACAGQMLALPLLNQRNWQVRCGLHIGPVVAGIVGQDRYQFDIWGDTVNVASRLTAATQPGTIAVLHEVALAHRCNILSTHQKELKGKGEMHIAVVSPLQDISF